METPPKAQARAVGFRQGKQPVQLLVRDLLLLARGLGCCWQAHCLGAVGAIALFLVTLDMNYLPRSRGCGLRMRSALALACTDIRA